MSPNFPTFSPSAGRPNEPSGARDELVKGFWTFALGLAAQRLRIIGGPVGALLTVGPDGFVIQTLEPNGNLTFGGLITFSDDVHFADNIVVGTLPVPYVQLSAGGIVIANDAASPLNIQWLDPVSLFGNTLHSPDLTSQSLDWELPGLGGVLPVVGSDAPAVAAGSLGKVDLAGQSADIGSTNLTNGPPSGDYLVMVYLQVTALDAGAGTATVTIGWTDTLGAATDASVALPLTATGRARAVIPVKRASGEITYSVTGGGTYGTARFAIDIRVVALG